MKRKVACILLLITLSCQLKAQYALGDNWKNNPLGFEPLNLHTSMGFFVPALAVGICVLATKRDSSLANRLSIYNESGIARGYKYPGTTLSQNSTGINLLLRRWLAIGVEGSLYFMRDAYNNTSGVALRPYARFYAVNRAGWRTWFESGGGFVYCFDYFPKPTLRDNRLGTHLNGTTRYGISAEINFTTRTSVAFGIRHVHISNGNSKGVERNPSHDSNGFSIGFAHVF